MADISCKRHDVVEHFGGRWWCDNCGEPKGVTVKFNPFAFTVEQNNEFIAKGYEPIINFDPRMG